LRAWVARTLGREDVGPLATAQGDFIENVTQYTDENGTRLIVAAPWGTPFGGSMTALAAAKRLPVLIAREQRPAKVVLAASDLERPGWPVLNEAARLARALGRPLVALHNVLWNVKLDLPAVGADWVWPGLTTLTSEVREQRTAELARVVGHLQVRAEAIVRSELSAADAIMSEASARDADLVVVGSRARGWLARWVTRTVAAEVAERARRSVLVTPLPDGPRRALLPACWM
jgi:nucleotide-binding universal stress UspA family protein